MEKTLPSARGHPWGHPAGGSGDTGRGHWSVAGLDAAVQGYPFEAWGLSGPELLGLDAGLLEALGVWPLGHQELLLEATEQLRKLVSAGVPGAASLGGTWGFPGLEEEDVGPPWAGWKGADGVALHCGAPWTQWRGVLRRP